MVSGNMTNRALLGDGDDLAGIFGGSIENEVDASSGNDQVFWTGGTIGGLQMGDGVRRCDLRWPRPG